MESSVLVYRSPAVLLANSLEEALLARFTLSQSAHGFIQGVFRALRALTREGRSPERVLGELGVLTPGCMHLFCKDFAESEKTKQMTHPLPMYTKYTKFTGGKKRLPGGEAKTVFELFLGFFMYFMYFCEYIGVFRLHLLSQACTSVYFSVLDVHGSTRIFEVSTRVGDCFAEIARNDNGKG